MMDDVSRIILDCLIEFANPVQWLLSATSTDYLHTIYGCYVLAVIYEERNKILAGDYVWIHIAIRVPSAELLLVLTVVEGQWRKIIILCHYLSFFCVE